MEKVKLGEINLDEDTIKFCPRRHQLKIFSSNFNDSPKKFSYNNFEKNFGEAIFMFKKFFAVFFLVATLLIIGQSSDAEAAWIRIGTYSDGTPALLGTHTIAGGRSNFSCDVMAGEDYIHYNFWYAGGGPYYRNTWPAEGYVYGSGSPVAIRIWEWVQSH